MNINVRLLHFGRGGYRWFFLSILLAALTVGGSIGLYVLGAVMLVRAAFHPPLAELQLAIVGIRFFGISRGFFRYLERYISHDATFRLLGKIRVWFYNSLIPIYPQEIWKRRSGDLLQRMVQDVETLQFFYLQACGPPIIAFLVGFCLTLLTLFFSHAAGTALALCFLFSSVVLPTVARIRHRSIHTDIASMRTNMYCGVSDLVLGSLEFLLFGRQSVKKAELLAMDRQLLQKQNTKAYQMGLISAAANATFYLSIFCLMYFLLSETDRGSISIIIPAALVLALLAAEDVFSPMTSSALQREECRSSAGRLIEILDTQPAVCPGGKAFLGALQNDLVFDRLSFHYPDENRMALRHVSFEVPTGACIAVVGPSGAGKSSLYYLLMRFYEFHQGRITLGGKDIRQFAPDLLRQRFSWSSQSPDFFHGTLRENLMIADYELKRERLDWAAELTQSKEWIERLPQGYDTFIGEQAAKLSAGQRRRIDLMRTLLHDAPILLFDEPLKHQDLKTADRIWEGITTQMTGKTVLIISHRLLGMGRFDQILVFQQGQMVECGRHDELMKRNGLYRHMWKWQKGLQA